MVSAASNLSWSYEEYGIFFHHVPVSYTHLDVYKRQAQRSNRQDFGFRKPFLDFAHTHAANKHSENLFDNRRGFRVGYKVVAVVRVWDCLLYTSSQKRFLREC